MTEDSPPTRTPLSLRSMRFLHKTLLEEQEVQPIRIHSYRLAYGRPERPRRRAGPRPAETYGEGSQ
jgi:hypothetical protein